MNTEIIKSIILPMNTTKKEEIRLIKDGLMISEELLFHVFSGYIDRIVEAGIRLSIKYRTDKGFIEFLCPPDYDSLWLSFESEKDELRFVELLYCFDYLILVKEKETDISNYNYLVRFEENYQDEMVNDVSALCYERRVTK